MDDNYYKKIRDNSPMGYAYHKIILDEKGEPCDYEFIEANSAFEKLTGLKASDIIGKRVTDVMPGIKNSEFNWIKFYGEIALNGGKEEQEQFIKPLNRWHKVNVYSPKKYYFVTFVSDTTKEKLELLKLDNFFEIGLDILSIANLEGEIVKVSKSWEDIFGYKRKELEGRKVIEFIHPDDKEKNYNKISNTSENGTSFNIINRFRCKDGSYKYIEWKSKLYEKLIYSIARDITDKIEEKDAMKELIDFSEEILRSSDEKEDYQKILDKLLKISGAKYSILNLYDENRKKAKTIAISADNDDIIKAVSIVGYSFIGKTWDIQKHYIDEEKIIFKVSSLHDTFMGEVPKSVSLTLEKLLNLGQIVIVKLLNGNKEIGNFTLIMSKNTEVKNKGIIEILARQMGLFLTRKAMQKSLIESEKKFRHYINNAPDGIFVVNEKGNYIEVNKAACEITKYSEEELLSMTLMQITPKENHEKLVKEFQAVLNVGRVYVELPLLRKDGVIRQWAIEGVKISKKRIMVFTKDITERKLAESEMIIAKEQAEAANITKSQFLANMSHEIRTPMNGIVGFLSLLETTELDETQLEYIDDIKISTETLLAVINDILDISKIEAGKMEIESIPFDLYSAVEASVIPYYTSTKEKGLELYLHIDDNIPKTVIGDPTRLRQIITNLISNAVKFTDKGYISMTIEIEGQTETTIRIRFKIKDTGIGISEESRQRLFKPFSQADASSTRRFGGTGLGLAICKSIAEMMNGEIKVESEEFKETTFTFVVQFNKIDREETQTNFKSLFFENENKNILDIKEGLNSELRILLVEDNENNKKFFVSLLKKRGLSCDVVEDGEQAVRACTEKEYDLIFMDCQMPVMDGYTATKIIREFEEDKRHAAIVALTAYTMKGDKEKCIEVGMDDYLSKPISIHDLDEKIRKYGRTTK
ncbi:MAG TPA: hypothetical protein DEP72_09380 [Clostridiales bacterium]|nr:MAG: hypothetical protein A2Y18_03990 [Clostridiales bacterium GWD2_32_19]HCC08352.1 hypothetical protein [Clostridiales bacterium]